MKTLDGNGCVDAQFHKHSIETHIRGFIASYRNPLLHAGSMRLNARRCDLTGGPSIGFSHLPGARCWWCGPEFSHEDCIRKSRSKCRDPAVLGSWRMPSAATRGRGTARTLGPGLSCMSLCQNVHKRPKLAKRGTRTELVRLRAVAGKLGTGGVPRAGMPSAPDLGETVGTARGGVLRPIFGFGGVVLPVKPAELLSCGAYRL